MTVLSTSYSSIDEVWADSYLAPQLQKPKKNKSLKAVQKDPICELYEMGHTSYDDSADLVSFANKYFEQHNKVKYQKPRMNERERQPVQVDVPEDFPPFSEPQPVRDRVMDEKPVDRYMEDSYVSDTESEYNYAQPKREKYVANKELFEEDMFNKKNNSFNQIDLILYIISGVILIFMMDQFVKIGQLMK